MFPLLVHAFSRRRLPGARILGKTLLCAGLLGTTWTHAMRAQELQTKPTPLSTYLDLRPAPPGAAPQITPDWIEALEFIPASTAAPDARAKPITPPPTASESELAASEADLVKAISASAHAKSVFRIRLQRPVGATDALQVRVFFDDTTRAARPCLTVWNELGNELMRSAPLGQGLGLPSSETLLVPMASADYLEIETPGDGASVRGAFLSWLGRTQVLQPKDFPSDEWIREPFGILPAAAATHDDAYLFGTVTAGLQDDKPLVLRPEGSSGATYQFELERQPLLAVVTCEILGATVDAPPTVSANQHPQGATEVHWPDLADPGFRGDSEEGKPQMSFRYTGWLRAQKVIPGSALNAGLNNLSVELSNGSKAIAVRSVSIQLKYNWEKFDYTLSPAPVSNAPH